MKSKLIVLALGIITLFVIPIYAKQQKQEVTGHAENVTYQQPEPKKYTCTLTDQQWQSVIFVVNNPDDVSVNQRKQITDLIQKNLIADTTKPKK